MISRILFFLAIGFFSFSISSCGDDVGGADCTANDFTNAVNPTISALNSAAQTWANDPSQANCDAYKDAANDYLDEVEKFDNCAGLNQTEFDQALASARDAVQQIPCN